jgi:hypothetical protein
VKAELPRTEARCPAWLCTCAGGLFAAVATAAPAPLDPAFLAYLEQYADARGEIFDARDLAETQAQATVSGQRRESSPDRSRPSAPSEPEKKP